MRELIAQQRALWKRQDFFVCFICCCCHKNKAERAGKVSGIYFTDVVLALQDDVVAHGALSKVFFISGAILFCINGVSPLTFADLRQTIALVSSPVQKTLHYHTSVLLWCINRVDRGMAHD